MSILIVVFCIALLIVLISQFKFNAFLAFLIVSITAGALLGMEAKDISAAIQTGIGSMLGSLVIIIVTGAMLGKLVAESGAAQRIVSGMMRLFGERYIQWALMVTGFIIGIPLFYNVGFVLVVPIIFSVVYRYKLPAVYIGLPMLAALSVTHGFLPPHPAPAALVVQFGADLKTTLVYGIIIAIPTLIIAGPIFAQSLKKLNPPILRTFEGRALPEDKLPGFFNSIISALLPVLMLSASMLVHAQIIDPDGRSKMAKFMRFSSFIGDDAAMVMLLSLALATYTLGIKMGTPIKKIMDMYADAVKDIAMILLIMAGAGALKQILASTGVSNEIANKLNMLDMHPLILGWLIACIIRICVGSATVAGLTAAGIIMPFIGQPGVDANLMVLAIGAGSLMCSHVNDAGFWMFKEYFNLGIKDTLRSWSLMETIVGVAGLTGVLLKTLSFIKMYIDLIALTSMVIGAQFAFYSGAFLPVSAIIIRQGVREASKNFGYWSLLFAAASLVVGIAIVIITIHNLTGFLFIYNFFLILAGLFLVARSFVNNDALKRLLEKRAVITTIALFQSTQVIQAVAALYAIDEPISFMQVMISILCFIFSSVIVVALLSLTFTLLSRLSRTGKLAGYLSVLFGVLSIILGLLNIIVHYG